MNRNQRFFFYKYVREKSFQQSMPPKIKSHNSFNRNIEHL